MPKPLRLLLFINAVVFFAVLLGGFVGFLGDFESGIVSHLSLPSSFNELLYKPWTLLTYMFLHANALHLLFNMLILFFFGKMTQTLFLEKQLMRIYLIGGVFGGLLFILFYTCLPIFGIDARGAVLGGASASILGLTCFLACLFPNYKVGLFLGEFRLKYLAAFVVLTGLAFMSSSNIGGHIAHLGGCIGGVCYGLFHKMRVKRSLTSKKKSSTNEVDRILDKIRLAGYESLTEKERRRLFEESRR